MTIPQCGTGRKDEAMTVRNGPLAGIADVRSYHCTAPPQPPVSHQVLGPYTATLGTRHALHWNGKIVASGDFPMEPDDAV